jgi:hypothetical protein
MESKTANLEPSIRIITCSMQIPVVLKTDGHRGHIERVTNQYVTTNLSSSATQYLLQCKSVLRKFTPNPTVETESGLFPTRGKPLRQELSTAAIAGEPVRNPTRHMALWNGIGPF